MNKVRRNKKLTSYELVEERLEEFSKRVSKIEEKVAEIEDKTRKSFEKYREYLVLLSHIACYDVLTTTRLTSLIGVRAPAKVEDFDSFITCFQKKREFEEKCEKEGINFFSVDPCTQMELLLLYSKNKSLSFEQIASYLIEKLGKDGAKQLIDKKSIMKYYGKEVIPIWEKLLEE